MLQNSPEVAVSRPRTSSGVIGSFFEMRSSSVTTFLFACRVRRTLLLLDPLPVDAPLLPSLAVALFWLISLIAFDKQSTELELELQHSIKLSTRQFSQLDLLPTIFMGHPNICVGKSLIMTSNLCIILKQNGYSKGIVVLA